MHVKMLAVHPFFLFFFVLFSDIPLDLAIFLDPAVRSVSSSGATCRWQRRAAVYLEVDAFNGHEKNNGGASTLTFHWPLFHTKISFSHISPLRRTPRVCGGLPGCHCRPQPQRTDQPKTTLPSLRSERKLCEEQGDTNWGHETRDRRKAL